MLNLKEWNELVIYGEKICGELKKEGYNVRLKPYEMHDKRKGLYIQVLDSFGNCMMEYASGVCGTFGDMKNNLDSIAEHIRREY